MARKRIQFVSGSLKKARYQLELQRKSLINLPPTEQSLLRRAILFKNQRLRQRAVQESKDYSDRYKDLRDSNARQWGQYWDIVRQERKNRREDWMLGPLAPMRDSGLNKNTYGAVDAFMTYPPGTMEDLKMKHIPFVKGDRVVVVTGRERGKIGKISSIQEDNQSADVEGVNEFDVINRPWQKRSYNTSFHTEVKAAAIPINSLRLVVPLPDPDTGLLKDVVVKSMELFFPDSRQNYVRVPEHYETKWDPSARRKVTRFIYPYYTNDLTEEAKRKFDALPNDGEPYYGDYLSKTPNFVRFIKGLDIPIPWPESGFVTYTDHDIDTLRIEVHEDTFQPSLEHQPLPPGVIDELRNKYSKRRTRHDPEYVEKKEMEAALQVFKRGPAVRTREMKKLDQMESDARRAMKDKIGLWFEDKEREGASLETDGAAERPPLSSKERHRIEHRFKLDKLEEMIAEARKFGTTAEMAILNAAQNFQPAERPRRVEGGEEKRERKA